MSNLINEIQEKITDKNYSAIDLLRGAKILASKLELKDMNEWIEYELDGYPLDAKLPTYRKNVPAQIIYLNPYLGWKPVVIEEEKTADLLENLDVRFSMSEIETIANRQEESVTFNLPTSISNTLRKHTNMNTKLARQTSQIYFTKIIDSVKTKLLDWILMLDENGVIGEDMSFLTTEKKKAKEPSKKIINNTYAGDKNKFNIKQSEKD